MIDNERIHAIMERAVTDPERALEEGGSLLEACRRDAPELAARLTLALALAANNCVRLDEGVRYLTEALDGFDTFEASLAFRTLRLCSSVLRSAGETTLAQRCLRQASTLLASFPDDEQAGRHAVLLDDQALVASQAGDFRRFLDLALEAAQRREERSPSRVMRLLLVAQAYRFVGEPLSASVWLERAMNERDLLPPVLGSILDIESATLADALGKPWSLARLEALEGAALVRQAEPIHASAMIPLSLRLANARPSEAITLARRAAHGLRFGGNQYVASSLLANAAQYAEDVGDLELAGELHRERFELAQRPSAMQSPSFRTFGNQILRLVSQSLGPAGRSNRIGIPVEVTLVPPRPTIDEELDALLARAGSPCKAFHDDAETLQQALDPQDRGRRARIALARAAAYVNRDLSALAVPHLLYGMRHIEALTSSAERSRLLRSLGRVLEVAGFHEAAIEVSRDSIARAAAAGDATEQARSLLSLGVRLERFDRLDEAQQVFEQTLTVARTVGGAVLRQLEPLTLAAMAYMQRITGDPSTAYKTIEQAMACLTDEAHAFARGQVVAERWAILGALGAPLDVEAIERELDAWQAAGHAQQVGDAARVVVSSFAAHDATLSRRFADRALEGLEAAELNREVLHLYEELIAMEQRHGHPRRMLELERRRADVALRERNQRDKLALAIDPLREQLYRLGVLSQEAAV